MTVLGPPFSAHLDEVRASLDADGVLAYLRSAVQDLWRANRDRYEPDELFDDALTVGFTAARNASNRVRAEIPRDERFAHAGIRVTMDHNAVVIRTAAADLRLVKAPLKAGRRPNFQSHFRWTTTEGRLAAARRNFRVHSEGASPGVDTLFATDVLLGAPATAERCRDVFVVWAAELDSGLTAGWLGMPTLGPQPFLAVTSAWWDEAQQDREVDRRLTTPSGDVAFGPHLAPTPLITLKPRSRNERTP